MCDYRWVSVFVLLLVSLPGRLYAQEPVAWRDPSPHTVQFVAVDNDVKLEVLDWGGSGRALVLLAGLGDTAHVFDDFAPKLTSQYHVYGITRRGFGASSAPVPANGNYSADRLGDDVLAVLDALKLERPVLVGHSIAGEELSSIGSRHPRRIAGLIYLDAASGYAYYNSSDGFFSIDLQNLKRQLDQLGPMNFPEKKELVQSLLQEDLPRIERDLKQMQEMVFVVPKPVTPAKVALPESERRERPGDRSVLQAVLDQEQKYKEIHAPVLAIYSEPHNWGTYKNANERDAAEAFDKAFVEKQAKAFETGVPSARVVRLPRADHYVFISNEADVLREMNAFLSSLP